MFAKIKNAKGFTLIEVLMVMIILGILVQISLTFTLDMRKRTYDAVALADGKNLMTVTGANFIGLDDVLYVHVPADGRNIGDLESDGATPRSPVFTLSSGVKASIFGDSPGVPGLGWINACVYHEKGSDDTMPPSNSGKKEFCFGISEITNTMSVPPSL